MPKEQTSRAKKIPSMEQKCVDANRKLGEASNDWILTSTCRDKAPLNIPDNMHRKIKHAYVFSCAYFRMYWKGKKMSISSLAAYLSCRKLQTMAKDGVRVHWNQNSLSCCAHSDVSLHQKMTKIPRWFLFRWLWAHSFTLNIFVFMPLPEILI